MRYVPGGLTPLGGMPGLIIPLLNLLCSVLISSRCTRRVYLSLHWGGGIIAKRLARAMGSHYDYEEGLHLSALQGGV